MLLSTVLPAIIKCTPGTGRLCVSVCVFACTMKINRPQKRQLQRQRQELRWLYFVQRGKCTNTILICIMHMCSSVSQEVQMINGGSGVWWEETIEEKEGSALWQGASEVVSLLLDLPGARCAAASLWIWLWCEISCCENSSMSHV